MRVKGNFLIVAYYGAVIIFQTLIAILPGILLVEERVSLSSELIIFISYLLLSEISQLLIRRANRDDQLIPLRFYALKVALSLCLIWLLIGHWNPQYGLILIAYEVFQFLSFSARYNFQNSLLQLFVAIFFKATVFNLMLSLSFPYTFRLFYFEPYLINALLILCLAIIANYSFDFMRQHIPYLLVLIGAFAGFVALLFYKLQHHDLTILLILIILLLIFISSILSQSNFFYDYRELILLITILLCQLIIYLN